MMSLMCQSVITNHQIRFSRNTPRQKEHLQGTKFQSQNRARFVRARCARDPLEGEVWQSWNGQEADWETENFDESELVDILFEEDGSPETAAQNILALALAFLLILAFGSIVWRIAIVSFALVSAAIRYSFVAILLIILLLFFF